ncbi:MAG: glycine zipper 2TM domain-containing protein [Pseudoxanthomonas sp.]
MIARSLLVLGLGLSAAVPALAQSYAYEDGYYDRDDDGARRSAYEEGYDGRSDDQGAGEYDTARVVRVDPIISRHAPPPRCYDRASDGSYADDGDGGDYYQSTGTPAGRTGATLLGSLIGGLVGSRFGGGSGHLVGTVAGAAAGSVAGSAIYDSNQRVYRGNVRVCEPAAGDDDGRVDGYDVTYEYAGRQYHTRTDYHPGDTIRVRVDVRATQ